MGNRKWEAGGGCHSERLRRIFSARRTYAKASVRLGRESGAGSSGGSAGSRLRRALRPEARNFGGIDAASFRARSGFFQRRRYFEMV